MSDENVPKVGRLAKLRKFRRRTIDSAQIRLGRKENSNHLENLVEENVAAELQLLSETVPNRRRSQKRSVEDDELNQPKNHKV